MWTLSKPHRPSSEGHSCVTTHPHNHFRRWIQAHSSRRPARQSVAPVLVRASFRQRPPSFHSGSVIVSTYRATVGSTVPLRNVPGRSPLEWVGAGPGSWRVAGGMKNPAIVHPKSWTWSQRDERVTSSRTRHESALPATRTSSLAPRPRPCSGRTDGRESSRSSPKILPKAPSNDEMPGRVSHCESLTRHFVVGVTGFEPATSSSRTKRATKLRHTPMAPRSGGPWRSLADVRGRPRPGYLAAHRLDGARRRG